jgi:hypothetical protein
VMVELFSDMSLSLSSGGLALCQPC